MTEELPTDDAEPSAPDTPALTMDALCLLYRNEETHPSFVRDLAAEIFHWTRDFHRLPDRALRLVEASAVLHNIGLYFGVNGHNVFSKEIILQHGIVGFDEQETSQIALAALFHRGKVRPEREPLFETMDAQAQSETLQIAAIVRVADGLDYSQDQSARLERLDDTRKTLRLYVGKPTGATLQNVDRANQKADLWNDAMPRPIRFCLDSGKKLYLRRGDTMQAAGHKVLRHYFLEMCRREPGVREDRDEEDLHQFRVAIRRLRAALPAFRKAFGRWHVEPFRDQLRDFAATTGAVRDLDVFLTAIEQLPSGGRVPSFVSHLRKERAEARQTMGDALSDIPFADFKAQFSAFLARGHPFENPMPHKGARRKVRRDVPALLDDRFNDVLAFRDRVGGADDADLHALRIACKRFRYIADFYGETLDAKRNVVLRPFKAMQDALGEVHDASVRAEYISRFVAQHGAELPEEERDALAALASESRDKGNSALDHFRTLWSAFASPENLKSARAAYGSRQPGGSGAADGAAQPAGSASA
jgi:CHAD domain-containing protein